MSKMDNLRAMREARYESTRAQARLRTGAPAKAPSSARATPAATPAASPAASPAAGPKDAGSGDAGSVDTGLCGHRSMNGRTCTREHGHAAKSHRYS